MVGRTLAIVLGVVAISSHARAQPVEPPPPEVAPAPAPAPAPVIDEAWAAYDAAFAQAARGDTPGAHAALAELARRWPGHPAAIRATAILEKPAPRPRDPNAPDKVARGELVFWSTIGGISLAASTCTLLDCDTSREYAAVYMGVIGGSLALSLAATRRGVRQGEAQLYNSAQTWGAWNALAINDDVAGTKEQAGIAIASQLGGLGLGIGLWQTWRPTAGDVALTNTFFLWGTVLTLWGHVAAGADLELRPVVLAGDAAILLGALVSRQVHMSRGRTLLIDIGGILGTLAGGLVAIGTDSERSAGVSLLVGTGAGLAIAAGVSKEWDAPPVKLAPTVMTGADHSTGWGVSAGFAF